MNNERYNISVNFCFSKSYFVILIYNFTPKKNWNEFTQLHKMLKILLDICYIGYWIHVSNYNELCSKNITCEEEWKQMQ